MWWLNNQRGEHFVPCWLTRPRAIIAINQPEYVEEQSDPDTSQQKEHTLCSYYRRQSAPKSLLAGYVLIDFNTGEIILWIEI